MKQKNKTHKNTKRDARGYLAHVNCPSEFARRWSAPRHPLHRFTSAPSSTPEEHPHHTIMEKDTPPRRRPAAPVTLSPDAHHVRSTPPRHEGGKKKNATHTHPLTAFAPRCCCPDVPLPCSAIHARHQTKKDSITPREPHQGIRTHAKEDSQAAHQTLTPNPSTFPASDRPRQPLTINSH